MSYSLVFHSEASKEFIDAYTWYENQQKGLGIRFEKAIDRIIKQLQSNPEVNGYVFKKYREAALKSFPFVLVYKINSRKRLVNVLAIYHTSRNPSEKFRKQQ